VVEKFRFFTKIVHPTLSISSGFGSSRDEVNSSFLLGAGVGFSVNTSIGAHSKYKGRC